MCMQPLIYVELDLATCLLFTAWWVRTCAATFSTCDEELMTHSWWCVVLEELVTGLVIITPLYLAKVDAISSRTQNSPNQQFGSLTLTKPQHFRSSFLLPSVTMHHPLHFAPVLPTSLLWFSRGTKICTPLIKPHILLISVSNQKGWRPGYIGSHSLEQPTHLSSDFKFAVEYGHIFRGL